MHLKIPSVKRRSFCPSGGELKGKLLVERNRDCRSGCNLFRNEEWRMKKRRILHVHTWIVTNKMQLLHETLCDDFTFPCSNGLIVEHYHVLRWPTLVFIITHAHYITLNHPQLDYLFKTLLWSTAEQNKKALLYWLFWRGINRWMMDIPCNGSVMWTMLPSPDVTMPWC